VLWHLLHQMLTALLVLHNKKYSHHDIKPENIFLFREITHEDFVNINTSTDKAFPEHYRGKLWLKLGDFGQTQRDAGETHGDLQEDPADVMGGTRLYRPPEMIEGKSGSYPSDLFSVGVVMCALALPCCACRSPFHPFH
jgi:serine/threonine protein kinase